MADNAELGRRLRQLHASLTDLAYRAGCLAREAEALADRVDPPGTHPCAPIAEHDAPAADELEGETAETGKTDP